MKTKLAAALAVAALAVACGAPAEVGTPSLDEGLSTTTTAAPTTTVPPTTTTTMDAITVAGSHYTRIVAPLNCAAAAVNAAWDELGDKEGYVYEDQWEDIKTVLLPTYAESSVAGVTFIEALAGYDWPAVVRDDIDDLMVEITGEAKWSDSMAKATDYLNFTELNIDLTENKAATVIRAKLGIETNVGLDARCDTTVILHAGTGGIKP